MEVKKRECCAFANDGAVGAGLAPALGNREGCPYESVGDDGMIGAGLAPALDGERARHASPLHMTRTKAVIQGGWRLPTYDHPAS